ncbi:MAG: alpha/beta hydrolase [Dehalococcoidales bacterium]
MTVIGILAAAVVVYIIFVGVLFIFQSRFIYFPERGLTADPAGIGLEFEEVALATSDGVTLSAWFIPSGQSRGTVLFCHGNAGNISDRLDSIQVFNQLGLDVLIFDYRGYGESQGTPDEIGTYWDAEAAWRYLIDTRGVDPGRVIVFGRSLGGAVAAWLAERHNPAMLILESSFVSLADIGSRVYPYLPVGLILRYRYDTAAYLTGVNSPVLVVHSRDDETMPFDQGLRLYRAALEPKRLLEISGSHNQGFVTSGAVYRNGLDGFISEYLGEAR